MNFTLLLAIIKQFQKTIGCPKCHTTFQSNNLDLIGITLNDIVFEAKCHACNNQIMVTTTEVKNSKDGGNINIHQNRNHQGLKDFTDIDEKDISKMHTFLKSFNGDFKKHL